MNVISLSSINSSAKIYSTGGIVVFLGGIAQNNDARILAVWISATYPERH